MCVYLKNKRISDSPLAASEEGLKNLFYDK